MESKKLLINLLKFLIMSYEITGKLIAVYDTMQRTETFRVREFVIEKTDDINGRIISNFIKFQCIQDKTELPSKFNLGDEVKVMFNLKGNRSERDGKVSYFTNLDAWRMESVNMMQTAANQSQMTSNNAPVEISDDLPF